MALCSCCCKHILSRVNGNFYSKREFIYKILSEFSFKRSFTIMENQAHSDNLLKREVEDIHLQNEKEIKKIKVDDDTNVEKKISPTSNRVRKPKKVVILLCYLGKNYYGMQRNHGVHTVESHLLQALLDSEIILEEELKTPQLMKFQRAARTDKGVSAVKQIVSLKIPQIEVAESFPNKVNQHLPSDIRILCVKRVTQAFDAKIACDARTYSYMLPTFAFSKSNPPDESCKISDNILQDVNDFLKIYVGTHNFYNFTSGRLPCDASCKRYIMSCECDKPFTRDGIEFAIIKIKGQSFMLHQIRKMVGLTIAVIKGFVSAEDVLSKVWKNDRIDIPMAPSLGLMLEEVHYDWYNTKYGSDGLHEPLKWDQYQESIAEFRERIINSMVTVEQNEKSMFHWLETLPCHTYDVREPKAPTPLQINSVSSSAEKVQTNV